MRFRVWPHLMIGQIFQVALCLLSEIRSCLLVSRSIERQGNLLTQGNALIIRASAVILTYCIVGTYLKRTIYRGRAVFKKFLSIMAMVLLSASAVPAAEQMTGGEYFFRYRTSSAPSTPSTPNDPGANKDITATYALGVGYAFSAKLPLKPEWEDDSWSYTGSLPAGISFDARSETFSGKATQAGLGTTIEMTGVDGNGAQVATAKVTFDVYTLPLDATYPSISTLTPANILSMRCQSRMA